MIDLEHHFALNDDRDQEKTEEDPLASALTSMGYASSTLTMNVGHSQAEIDRRTRAVAHHLQSEKNRIKKSARR